MQIDLTKNPEDQTVTLRLHYKDALELLTYATRGCHLDISNDIAPKSLCDYATTVRDEANNLYDSIHRWIKMSVSNDQKSYKVKKDVLTAEELAERNEQIYTLNKEGTTRKELARQFGISVSAISKICSLEKKKEELNG